MRYPIHQGQAVERIIRSKGYSITEFAKLANVNRRFIFIWLSQSVLKPRVLKTISKVLDHDLITEFAALNSNQNPDHITSNFTL